MKKIPHESVSHGTKEFPFACYPMEYRPGFLVPLHWHEEVEVLCIERGSLSLTAGAELLTGRAGDVFFLNPEEIHGITSEDPSLLYHALVFPLRFAAFSFQGSSGLLLPLSEGRLLLSHQFPEDNKKEACGIIHRLLHLYKRKTPGYIMGIQICCAELLYTLYAKGCYEALSPAEPALALKRDILKYLRDNFTERLSLEELSCVFHLSPKYFSRFFKKNFQMTLTEYLNSLRLENAVRLLSGTELSVTEIALQSGFHNVSYFIRCFRKCYGCSPLGYRRKPEAGISAPESQSRFP